MKPWFLLLIYCACTINSGAQLSLPGSVSEDQSIYTNRDDDKETGTYTNGNKLYLGYKRKENWHGQWNSWYNNGQLLDSGSMKMGIPDKTWTGWYPDGTRPTAGSMRDSRAASRSASVAEALGNRQIANGGGARSVRDRSRRSKFHVGPLRPRSSTTT